MDAALQKGGPGPLISYLRALAINQDRDGLVSLLGALIDEGRVPQQVSREVLRELAPSLSSLPVSANAFVDATCVALLEALKNRVTGSLEEVDLSLRSLLCNVCWGINQFARAGLVLSQAKIDSPSFVMPDGERAKLWLMAVNSYLKCNDYVPAERCIKRAGEWVSKARGDVEVKLTYTTAWAQLLDYGAVGGGQEQRKKFLDAAIKYGEVSRVSAAEYDEGELLAMLTSAVRCALLAPVGPARQRIMGVLSRDERIGAIPPVTNAMLFKVISGEMIYVSDAEAFEASLPPHCRSIDSQGRTIFSKAVADHNILAVAKVYRNISFASLGEILVLPPSEAEKQVSRLVSDGKLAASIDKVEEVVDFNAVFSGKIAPKDADTLGLLTWDADIRVLCGRVNSVVEGLGKLSKK